MWSSRPVKHETAQVACAIETRSRQDKMCDWNEWHTWDRRDSTTQHPQGTGLPTYGSKESAHHENIGIRTCRVLSCDVFGSRLFMHVLCVCVCVCVFMHVFVYRGVHGCLWVSRKRERDRERESVCVCVCVCVRERERERERERDGTNRSWKGTTETPVFPFISYRAEQI